MSELSLRLVVVGGVLALVAVAVLFLRRRDRSPSRRVGKVGFEPGIYLFTSASCLDCHVARELLETRLGADGFVEYAWEEHPRIFETLSIDRVPCSLVVDVDGRGTLWIGHPDPMIYALDP
ncbi:MAG: hypothetical protein WDZ96_00075 [Acidimicrobiia bacterium]